MPRRIPSVALRAGACLGLALAVCLPRPAALAGAHDARAVVLDAVGSTNVYADVISQIGGAHVSVTGILSNPNADPHTYESSPRDAEAVARAALVVQNGLGYDSFMSKLENASPRSTRVVIDAGRRLGYADGANPHIWYAPTTMPRVAALIAAALSRQDPADRAYFAANLRTFTASLQPWTATVALVRKRYGGTPVAITEPVFGYALQAMALRIMTPPSFAMAIMTGNDPAPQDVQIEQDLLSHRTVRCFFYNQQAVTPVTARLLDLARSRHIAIVGVDETRPLGKTYQAWMLAQARATLLALSRGVSTERLT